MSKTCRIKKYLESGYVLTWCGQEVFMSDTAGRPKRADDEECAKCKAEQETAEAADHP